MLPTISDNPITFNGLTNFSDITFETDYVNQIVMEVNFTSLHELGETLTEDNIIRSFKNDDVENVELNPISAINGIYKY